ncbi:MAG: hypothetical protein RH917_00980 [Lacipirellulaceae bacterium]
MSKFHYFNADNKLRRLIQKSLDEPLTGDEVRELEQALQADPNLRLAYLEATQMHVSLVEHGQALEMCRRAAEEFPKSTANAVSRENLAVADETPSRQRLLRFPSLPKALPYAAALLLVGMGLGCGLGIVAASVMYKQPEFTSVKWNYPSSPGVTARVVATADVSWQASESPDTLPTRNLKVGQEVRLDAGLVEIAFRDGAHTILEGPGVLEIRSGSSCKLYSGKLCVSKDDETPSNFVVDTPSGVIQLRAGQFGLVTADQTTHCHNFTATMQVEALREVSVRQALEPKHNQLVELDAITGIKTILQPADPSIFTRRMPSRSSDHFTDDVILLGNLFDDGTTASLTQAMQTDAYQAAGETIDLGVAAVRDGGLDVDFPLFDAGPRFNLINVGGGGPRVRGLPSNDTYRSTHAEAIRTLGELYDREDAYLTKVEDGIGMCTNEMITFDLQEIRDAGHLGKIPMRLKVDRAGVNDRFVDSEHILGGVRFVVILSNRSKVQDAYVNGEHYPIQRKAGVYSFDLREKKAPRPIQRGRGYVAFDVPIPADVTHLTLATTMCGLEDDDHAVFSGARLEIIREASPQATAAK